MAINVAISGYGAVAAVHARQIRERSDVRLSAIYGPREDKARAFAEAHGVARAEASLEAALEGADAILICSPSPQHFGQAGQALDRGVPALVELPACASLQEAETLAEKAARGGVRVNCAHTSRYTEPFHRVAECLRSGVLGEIHQVTYVRHIPPRTRSWVDNALLHHAEHPLDLFLDWFGAMTPLACAAHPSIEQPQNLVLAAEFGNGAPMALSISYTSRIGRLNLVLAGSAHALETDGFSYLRSDLPELRAEWDGQETYERAIREQDALFLDGRGVPWEETMGLARVADEFRKLWVARCGSS